MTEVPPALQAALMQRGHDAPATPPVELHASRVSRGDLRVIRPFDGTATQARLGLVLSVDSARDFAEVMLVHTASELACETDAIITSEMASPPYAVVIETDVRGVVWTWQLGGIVGHLHEDVLVSLGPIAAQTLAENQAGVALVRGISLAGPADPRWSFKKAEGETLRLLGRDCTEALLDDGSPWVVDPGLLRPELLDLAADSAALVTELMHWIGTRSLEVTTSDVEHLLELGVFELDAWATTGDIAGDVVTALHMLIEQAATAGPIPRATSPASWRIVTALHLEQTWSTEPEAVHYLGDREGIAA